MTVVERINDAVRDSFVGRYFEMEKRNATFFGEWRGATATFMSMAYILAVNPRILADSGGPCDVTATDFEDCLTQVRREYVTATALGSIAGTLLMGIMANLPVALAPGMGMNAYFTYSVVGFYGSGSLSYSTALTAVLIEGVIFVFLAVTGARYFIIKLLPEPVRLATPAAIGAFLAHLGLQSAEGLGVVVSDLATAVTLGGCPVAKQTPVVAYNELCRTEGICIPSGAFTCDDLGGVMTSGTTWLGILGTLIIATMLAYKNRSAFITGIAFVTIVSWIRNTAVSYFPDSDSGDDRFDYFKQVVRVEPLGKILFNYDFGNLSGVAVALVTFLYVDFLDTSGTLLGLVSSLGYVDENGDFPRSRWAYSADGVATIIGSMFGLSPVTSYIESGAGVEAGAKTGLTAMIVAFYFFLSIFFAPVIASIPPWATGGALVVVGALMARSLGEVKWHNPMHATTAFLTVIMMPLTYSIAYGLIAGIGTYMVMWTVFKLLAFLGINEPNFDEEDEAMMANKPSSKSDAVETAVVAKGDADGGNGNSLENNPDEVSA